MKLLAATFAAINAQEGSGSPLEQFPIPVGSCYTCNSMTWDECNRKGRVERCMDNEQVCEVEVRYRSGNIRQINMGCKWADACQDNKVQNFAGPDGDREFAEYQCKPWSWNKPSICRQCCNEDSNCGLDFLKEGRRGYGPQTINGWQKKMVEYEYFLAPVTEEPEVTTEPPVTEIAVREDGCPLEFLDRPRVSLITATSDRKTADTDGELLEFAFTRLDRRLDIYCGDFIGTRWPRDASLFQRGNIDEIIVYVDDLPDFCLELPTNTIGRENGIRFYTDGDNWSFDGIELTINDKENCETIVFNYPGGQVRSHAETDFFPISLPRVSSARLPGY